MSALLSLATRTTMPASCERSGAWVGRPFHVAVHDPRRVAEHLADARPRVAGEDAAQSLDEVGRSLGEGRHRGLVGHRSLLRSGSFAAVALTIRPASAPVEQLEDRRELLE